RQKEVPTASFATVFNDRREQTIDHRGYIDAKYDGSLSPDLQLLGRVFYDRYTYQGDYPLNYAAPGSPPDIVLNRDFSFGEWIGTEWQLNARLADRHVMVVGGEYRENLHQDQFNYDVSPRIDYLLEHASSRTLGLYSQWEIELSPDLWLNA